jgi:hypothetical protein
MGVLFSGEEMDVVGVVAEKNMMSMVTEFDGCRTLARLCEEQQACKNYVSCIIQTIELSEQE